MRTFIENYLHFMENCIRPHYEKLKPLKSGFIENSIFENNRDPCLQTYSSTTGSYCLSYLQYPQSAHHCVYSTLYSVHPQSTSTPSSMAGIIAAEGASPSKHTSEQPVFMHQVQCHEKRINKCFFVIQKQCFLLKHRSKKSIPFDFFVCL